MTWLVNILHFCFAQILFHRQNLLAVLSSWKPNDDCCTIFTYLWQAWVRLGGILQPNFLKTLKPFSSKTTPSASLWTSICPDIPVSNTERSPNNDAPCFQVYATKENWLVLWKSLSSNSEKLLLTLRISTSILLLAFLLFWKDETISIISFLFMLCCDSFL